MVVATLGLRLDSPAVDEHLRGRVDVGIETLRETDASHVVFSGARTNPDVAVAEAEAMREYAVERGVDPDRILVEDRAWNTIGNAYFTRRLLEDRGIDAETIRVVTSCYHADRAAYLFRQCFGAESDVVVDHCYDYCAGEDARRTERRLLEDHRERFEGIEPGDIETIRREVIAAFDQYEGAATFE